MNYSFLDLAGLVFAWQIAIAVKWLIFWGMVALVIKARGGKKVGKDTTNSSKGGER